MRSYLDDFARNVIETLQKGQEELAHLLSFVRMVVGSKSRRFYESLNRLAEYPDPGRTFFEITRPDLQIRQLVEAIHGYFRINLNPNEERIRISLMGAVGGQLEVTQWFPDADVPRNHARPFDGQTLAGLAYATRQLLISADLRSDERYQHFGGRDSGSMFSYPIFDELLGEVVYVVNVVSTKTDRFNEKERNKINKAMEIFAERIILEHRLQKIKDRALAKQASGDAA